MKCEAIVRGASATNGDTPQSLFNQIRTYVNAPHESSTPSLQDILDEDVDVNSLMNTGVATT